jgi:hypothetical protein
MPTKSVWQQWPRKEVFLTSDKEVLYTGKFKYEAQKVLSPTFLGK